MKQAYLPRRFFMSFGRPASLLAVFLVAASLRADLVPTFSQTVFVGGGEGPGGTPRYRIPTLTMAPDGTLLAFAEGRQTQDDPGSGYPISMNCKRSTDRGRTWNAIQVLASDPAYAYSDPRVLVDRRHNQVFLFYTQWPVRKGEDDARPGNSNDSSVLLYRSSRDNGRTWGAPVNLNPALKKPDWYMLASIVGVGVQLSRQTATEGGANGRLIFPAGFADSDRHRHNISIYSDDAGTTWRISPSFVPENGPTESDLVELADGQLLLSARNDGPDSASRYHYLSADGGLTWTLSAPVRIPVCRVDCGLVYIDRGGAGRGNSVLISAPLGTPVGSGIGRSDLGDWSNGRSNLGVWKSLDEGATFPTYHQLIAGFSGYSQIIRTGDGTVGIIFEATNSTKIVFLECPLDRL